MSTKVDYLRTKKQVFSYKAVQLFVCVTLSPVYSLGCYVVMVGELLIAGAVGVGGYDLALGRGKRGAFQ